MVFLSRRHLRCADFKDGFVCFHTSFSSKQKKQGCSRCRADPPDLFLGRNGYARYQVSFWPYCFIFLSHKQAFAISLGGCGIRLALVLAYRSIRN